ncbi:MULTISPECIES: DUF2225 domain-containing protein [unclassified Bacillus (in: firmicutes)]|uniref:DUF2225 domain-containing protein n=1 Tax=unclassified Bacillus (in: firmicutes) TaxID=185979 RepID=UPI0008E7E026|nr:MULTISPECIES: DUF2225 domain-containing protein [unclassified Bacillus (in: firmicutes)]SFB12796.1 hypothetical protein SAMN02799634_106139 [Bacillus sp. UNCCL13]SFQ90193.1 hypothetical protein SAMN04488577_3680 [Bacillus sp. cl95]
MTQLEPIFDKKCECLVCKKAFTTKRVRSRFVKVTEYDTDFFPIYASDDTNPIFYHINVCPNCGFSFSDDSTKYFPPGAEQLIFEKVSSQWVTRDFGGKRTIHQAIQAYKLAIFCGLLKKEKHITLAGMYLRVAWLYRTLEDSAQEQRFIKLAVHEYVESYLNDDFRGTQVSEIKILYLVGELSRRNGAIDQAVKYFSKVIEKQKQSVEPRIIEMARDRWHDIRESRLLDV